MKENFMEVLDLILNAKDNKEELVREFQNKICDGDDYSDNEEINEILGTLAYDLEFYVPNDELRNEDESYYSDERLKVELIEAIKKIEFITKSIN